MAGSTERGIVYPTSGDSITPLESAFATLAQTADDAITDLEPQTVQVFENTSERDAASVPEGSFCYVKNNDTPYYFDGTDWVAFTPSQLPASVITSGVFDSARIPTNISVDYANTAGSTSSASYATSAGSASSVPWTGVTSKPSTFPPSSHTHAAGDITSGTFSTSRIPTITGSMIANNTIQGTQGSGTSNIVANTIGQGDIGPDSIGPGELIESGDFDMRTLTTTLSVTAGTSLLGGALSVSGTIQSSGPGTTSSTSQAYWETVAAGVYAIKRPSSLNKFKLFQEPLDVGLKALQMQPKTWIDKTQYENNGNSVEGLSRYPGFVVEDFLQAGLEDFVIYGENNEPEAIAYDRLVAAVIPVLKHQQEKIESLETRLAALEGKVQ